MSKKKNKEEEKISKAEESGADYGVTRDSHKKNEIVFFSSFEEMNEHDHREMANSTPLERLQHITEYIKHAYADELKKKMKMKIYFR